MFKRQPKTEIKNLLIIKLDAIGDYVLFRNFLEIIHRSAKYKDYQITFCGSSDIKDLAETLDNDFVDKFIWIDKAKMAYKPFYFLQIAKFLYGRFSVAIQATYSRDVIGDVLIKLSEAPKRFGFRGDLNNQSAKKKIKTDTWYTELIDIDENNFFEFNKNKEFFEKICEEKINLSAAVIDRKKIPDFYFKHGFKSNFNNYVVIFPGANQSFRRFYPAGFAIIIDYLWEKYSYLPIIAGSQNDQLIAAAIKASSLSNIINLTGQTSLIELTALISESSLLISNDTAAVHLAMALGTKTIVLSQFNHYGRFVPYPKEMAEGRMHCLTPDKYKELNERELIKKFSKGSRENIDLIKLEDVFSAIDKLL